MPWTGPWATWQDDPVVGAPTPPVSEIVPTRGPSPSGGNKECCTYWDQVRYKSYRVANPVVGGGNFAVDSEPIRNGYYWLVLHAAFHLEIGSQIAFAFFMCTEPDRGVPPILNVSNSAFPEPGIVLQGNQPPMNSASAAWNVISAMPGSCPVLPVVIPNGFFLRALTFQTNNTPAQGTFGVMRIMYLELPVGDPGPLLAF